MQRKNWVGVNSEIIKYISYAKVTIGRITFFLLDIGAGLSISLFIGPNSSLGYAWLILHLILTAP